MSTSWKPAGQSADFSSDLTTLVKTELTDNWNDTTGVIAEADIKFGTDWWDGYGDYQIHCTDPRYLPPTPASNDWRRFDMRGEVDIHIFVRGNSEDRPTAVFNLTREVNRIIGQNVQGITGASYIKWSSGISETFTENNLSDVWHGVGTVEVYWQQVNTA